MKNAVQIEHRASSSRSKHEGESSFGLCDRLSRTRDNSQRQLPTDQDYAVSTREYQTDQSSLKTAPAAARSVLDERPKRRQQQTHRLRRLTRSLHIRPYRSHKGVCRVRDGMLPPCPQSKRIRDAAGFCGLTLSGGLRWRRGCCCGSGSCSTRCPPTTTPMCMPDWQATCSIMESTDCRPVRSLFRN